MRFSVTLVTAAFIIVRTSGESAEDSFLSGSYSPHHMNFNEIFSNSLSMLADDSLTNLVTRDEEFHLNSMPSQFSEFRLQSYTTPPMETTSPAPTPPTSPRTTPPPRFPKAAYLRPLLERRFYRITNGTTTTIKPTSRTTTTMTTMETTTKGVYVVPLQPQQRGVLDLIMPAARVKNFKDVFEKFRRLLSYTFRK